MIWTQLRNKQQHYFSEVNKITDFSVSALSKGFSAALLSSKELRKKSVGTSLSFLKTFHPRSFFSSKTNWLQIPDY